MRSISKSTRPSRFSATRLPILILMCFLAFQLIAEADAELDEKLKSVMLHFEKNNRELTAQINQLRGEQESLLLEIEKIRAINQALRVENRQLKNHFIQTENGSLEPMDIVESAEVEEAALAEIDETPKPVTAEPVREYASPSVVLASQENLVVNVNVATAAELDLLPGVGPVIAQRIIDERPFETVDDLVRVKGIGNNLLEVLRPKVRVH